MIEPSFFNELAKTVHENENKKWWFDKEGKPLSNPESRLIMLVISEVIEAMEGDRKDLMDDKLPHRKMVEVEMADAVIRLLDRMEGKNLRKFRNLYKYKDTYSSNEDITKGMYEIVKMLANPVMVNETEIIVHNILDLSTAFGYDVLSAIDEKRAYNANRKDHTYESREGVNGKKY